MRKLTKKIAAFAVTVAMMLGNCYIANAEETIVAETTEVESVSTADTSIYPKGYDDLSASLRHWTELVATDTGYMRLVCIDEEKTLYIEYYDDSFNILSEKTITYDLEYWGGFHAGSDAYYVVTGQSNTAESYETEVIRVEKYDKNWNKLGTASITGDEMFGGDVRYPFDYGCVDVTELNGKLYIATGHEGYVDPAYNQGHQGMLVVEVDEATMTGEIILADFWHSFAQYIETDGTDLYLYELSEGSRGTTLKKFNTGVLDYWGDIETTSTYVLEYGGVRDSAWAIACYASVDDMTLSANNVLGLGTSIDQSTYDSVTSDTAHNIYLTITPKNDISQEATTVKWMTDYTGEGKAFYNTKLVKINDNRFMLMWEEYETSQAITGTDILSSSILHYVFIDENGNLQSEEMTAAAPLSNCEPIVKGSNVVLCASNGICVGFYTIDTTTGAFNKKIYNVAGESAGWKIEDNTLVVYGTGSVGYTEEYSYRYPRSSCKRSYSYSSHNPWNVLSEQFDKIVVEGTITTIVANAFENLDNVIEIELKSGVTTIGDEAFAFCGSLDKVKIPDSVTSIGVDIVWTGGYWISDDSHVNYATIYTTPGAYAAQYAQENEISYTFEIGDGSPGWHEVDDNWYYLDEDGKMETGLLYIDGEKYYFDSNGVMQTGWVSYYEEWLYFDDTGAMVYGWQEIDGKWYYFDGYGHMVTDTWIDGYYINEDGVWEDGSTEGDDISGGDSSTEGDDASGGDSSTGDDSSTGGNTTTVTEGWQQSGGRWWYQNSDGTYPSNGWKYIGNTWYYFDNSGWMKTGWVLDGATWYYMNPSGAMATGWVLDGATWYYMNPSGAMATGWVLDGATWYYMNPSGAMATGWVLDGATWYYMNSSGAMATGWVLDGATWYYMNPSGAMATGWVLDGATWYYMNPSGAMATGWVLDGATWYYMNPSGAMATGWILDGSTWYNLDASGAWIAGSERSVDAVNSSVMGAQKIIGGLFR